MKRLWFLLFVGALFLIESGSNITVSAEGGAKSTAPVYTSDGKLVFPPDYREWMYLTTGLDMDYNPEVNLSEHSMFDNVFVNPDAYKAFLATGTWPEKTVFVLEGRVAGSKGSINKGGHYQTTEIMSRSIHVKDSARFASTAGWSFFGYDDSLNARQMPKEAACYSCHQDHGAVDTTFVQFYPTLLNVAKQEKTFSPGYMKDEAEAAKK